jgi:hypothetical protein
MIFNLTALQTEYETDPETRGYAGMNDAILLADFNEKRYPYKRLVPNREMKAFAFAEDLLSKIVQEGRKAENGASVASQAAQDTCIYFLSLFNDPEGTVDFEFTRGGDNAPLIEIRLDALVAAGIMDESTLFQKTKCLGLASITSLSNLTPLTKSRVEILYGTGALARLGGIEVIR